MVKHCAFRGKLTDEVELRHDYSLMERYMTAEIIAARIIFTKIIFKKIQTHNNKHLEENMT